MQRKMGYRDLRTVKEFILRKSYQDDELSQDEERFMDALNRQVRSCTHSFQHIKQIDSQTQKCTCK